MAPHSQVTANLSAGEKLNLRYLSSFTGLPETVNLTDPVTSMARDAFGRFRVALPYTVFDSKQLGDKRPLFWDDQETSGSGTGTTYSADTSSTVLDVSNTTAGTRVRQTFERFNYQPGKSQAIFLTLTPGATSTGITKRWGYYDDANGIFFQLDGGIFGIGIRSSTSGSPVDTIVTESNFLFENRYDLDFTKSLIFVIDFEWLGVGSVRTGVVIDGDVQYLHAFHHSNKEAGVYMTTPNLPVRYEIINDGTGAADTLETICSTVISEGGQDDTGIVRGISGGATATLSSTNSSANIYAAIGLRLKSTHLDNQVKLVDFSMNSASSDDVEWIIMLNPDVAGTFTFNAVANSAVEVAIGSSNTNTVTNGTVLANGYVKAQGNVSRLTSTLRNLGSTISGTADRIVLCHRPITSNATIYSAINWKELS